MKSETRDLIIRTASDLFYENGYNLVGINTIIEKAGIAKATLYSHFKSKEDLCVAYLEAKDEELLKNIRSFCATKQSGNDRLVAVLEFLIPFFEQEDFNGCWCIRTVAEISENNETIRNNRNNTKTNENIRKTIRNNKKQFLNFITQLVKTNRADLKEAEQKTLARQIYLLYEGAVSESHLQGEIWPIEENIRLLKSML